VSAIAGALGDANLSIMPEDLVTKMPEQDLVDLLEFLSTLKDERRTAH